MTATRLGFAMTGSFCTFDRALQQLDALCALGYDVCPILSFQAASLNTRFMTAETVKERMRAATGKEPLCTLESVEPIGPRRLLDLYVLAPLTGASLGKLARGICDTPALLGAKSHLRNGRSVVVAISTNDGLAASAEAIGHLLNTRNVYFVPFRQDDPTGKPRSLVARMELLPDTVAAALAGAQIQPIIAG